MKLLLLGCLLAFWVASATGQDAVPDGVLAATCQVQYRRGVCRPRYPRCPFGDVCIGRYCCRRKQCPLGLKPGPRCGTTVPSRRCPYRHICIRGRCCGFPTTLPPRCPNGVRPTKRCSKSGTCSVGYSCTRGWCCKPPACPRGWIQLPGATCVTNVQCPPGSICRGGVCCAIPKFPPVKCPPGRRQVKGSCVGDLTCPKFSDCYQGRICCRRIRVQVKCPAGKRQVKGSCVGDLTCPKFSECYQGRICCRSIRDVITIGFCPIRRPADPTVCTDGGESCSTDADCSTGQKCCDNGGCGGKICKKAIFLLPPSPGGDNP